VIWKDGGGGTAYTAARRVARSNHAHEGGRPQQMDDKLRPRGVGNPEGGQADAWPQRASSVSVAFYDADSRTKELC
jgi:hypothetical protein